MREVSYGRGRQFSKSEVSAGGAVVVLPVSQGGGWSFSTAAVGLPQVRVSELSSSR